MKYTVGILVFLVIETLHIAVASAQGAVYHKVVARGRDVSLGFYVSINPDCSSRGYMTIAVLNSAQGGLVFSEHTRDYATFVPGNPRSACNKLRLPGTRAYYHARADYTGADSVALQVVTESGDVFNYNF